MKKTRKNNETNKKKKDSTDGAISIASLWEVERKRETKIEATYSSKSYASPFQFSLRLWERSKRFIAWEIVNLKNFIQPIQ